MVESPETVHRFLDEVEGKVREVERREIGELRAFKAERLGKSVQEVTLNRWDLPYYQEQLKKARYNIDQEALRAYFPTDASVAWVFAISGSLYGVRFVPARATRTRAALTSSAISSRRRRRCTRSGPARSRCGSFISTARPVPKSTKRW